METSGTFEQSTDILHDFEPSLERASVGKRFLNYVIDFVAFIIFGSILFATLASIAPETFGSLVDDDNLGIFDRLITMAVYALFMGLQETIFKGASLGKLCTGTRAVNLDGSKISARTAFLRGLCRIVPFEPLSTFGQHPWHDKWTDTLVIDKKKSTYV
jgi:uncharacterized RDD family membrane protein YckC